MGNDGLSAYCAGRAIRGSLGARQSDSERFRLSPYGPDQPREARGARRVVPLAPVPVSLPVPPVAPLLLAAPPEVEPAALLPLAPVPAVPLVEPDVPPFALREVEPPVAPVAELPEPLMPLPVLLLAPDGLEFVEPVPALPELELCAYAIPTATDIIPADAAIIHLFIEHLSFR